MCSRWESPIQKEHAGTISKVLQPQPGCIPCRSARRVGLRPLNKKRNPHGFQSHCPVLVIQRYHAEAKGGVGDGWPQTHVAGCPLNMIEATLAMQPRMGCSSKRGHVRGVKESAKCLAP
jgi:hypothetical protein